MYQTPESCVWRIFNSNKSCFRAIINNFWIILFGQFHFRSIISISFGNSKKTHWTHHPCWHFLPNNWQFWVLIFGRFSQTLVSYLWVVLTSTSFTQISGLHEYIVLSMAEPVGGIWAMNGTCSNYLVSLQAFCIHPNQNWERGGWWLTPPSSTNFWMRVSLVPSSSDPCACTSICLIMMYCTYITYILPNIWLKN